MMLLLPAALRDQEEIALWIGEAHFAIRLAQRGQVDPDLLAALLGVCPVSDLEAKVLDAALRANLFGGQAHAHVAIAQQNAIPIATDLFEPHDLLIEGSGLFRVLIMDGHEPHAREVLLFAAEEAAGGEIEAIAPGVNDAHFGGTAILRALAELEVGR